MQRIGLSVFLSSFFVGVLSIVWFQVGLALSLLILLLGSTWIALGARSRRRSLAILGLVATGLGLALARNSGIPDGLPHVFEQKLETKVQLEGVVVALPDMRETSTRLTIEIAENEGTTRIIAAVPGYPRVHTGDAVRVSGKLSLPEPFAGDGGRVFRYDDYLRKEGVYAVVQPAYVEVVGQSDSRWLWLLRLLERTRTGFMRAVAGAIPEPESALAVGLIAGGKQGLGEELIEAFTIAGLLQIVVLSGYNVMVIANGIQKALGFLPNRIGAILACISIACFVLAAGGGSPALRAGLMALICILAKAFGSPLEVIRTLFITLFLLSLWNPLLLPFDPGLQFSFLATLGLILGTPLIADRLQYVRNETFRELLASSLAAQIGVMPILLWQTGNLSLVAIAANIIVTPVIPLAMAASAAAAGVAFLVGSALPILPLVAGIPAYTLLAFIIKVAQVSAALPYAQVTVPAFGFWVVPAAYGVLGYGTWRAYKKRPLPEGGGRFESFY